MSVSDRGTIPCTPARCLQLVRQPDINWCVPACVQMVLGFYGKATELRDVACALKLLGTDCSGSAVDFPAGSEQLVVDVMQGHESRLKVEVKSRGAGVDFWTLVKDQIGAEAPVILFNHSHARVVSGYLSTQISGGVLVRGLDFFDPLSSTSTCWESFDACQNQYTHLFLSTFTEAGPLAALARKLGFSRGVWSRLKWAALSRYGSRVARKVSRSAKERKGDGFL
jgi:peptidase C39-like protein